MSRAPISDAQRAALTGRLADARAVRAVEDETDAEDDGTPEPVDA